MSKTETKRWSLQDTVNVMGGFLAGILSKADRDPATVEIMVLVVCVIAFVWVVGWFIVFPTRDWYRRRRFVRERRGDAASFRVAKGVTIHKGQTVGVYADQRVRPAAIGRVVEDISLRDGEAIIELGEVKMNDFSRPDDPDKPE